LDCASVDASFITHSIAIDTVNSNAVAMAAVIETIDQTLFTITFDTSDRTLDTLTMVYTVSTYISTSR
jgi:hypothetical protein